MNTILNKFNLILSWQADEVSVYSNDNLCLRLTEPPRDSENPYTIKIDYVETFDRWSVAFYYKSFDKMDDTSIIIIDKDIEKLMEIKSKAIIEYIDEEGCNDYRLDYDYLKSAGY